MNIIQSKEQLYDKNRRFAAIFAELEDCLYQNHEIILHNYIDEAPPNLENLSEFHSAISFDIKKSVIEINVELTKLILNLSNGIAKSTNKYDELYTHYRVGFNSEFDKNTFDGPAYIEISIKIERKIQ